MAPTPDVRLVALCEHLSVARRRLCVAAGRERDLIEQKRALLATVDELQRVVAAQSLELATVKQTWIPRRVAESLGIVVRGHS